MTSPDSILSLRDAVAPSDEGPFSSTPAHSRLDLLVRVLVAVAVDDLSRNPEAVQRLDDASSLLALPFTPSLLEFLDAYADDLAENERPSSGTRHALVELVLLRNFSTPVVRELLDAGADDGFTASTNAVSLIRLLSAACPLLTGSRPAPGAFRTRSPESLGTAILEIVAERLGPMGGARFASVMAVRSVDDRFRMSLAPLGGRASQATGSAVAWTRGPVIGELCIVGGAIEQPARLTPWVRASEEQEISILTASARDSSLRYVALAPDGTPPPPPTVEDELLLAPWIGEIARIQSGRTVALRRIADRFVDIGSSMVSDLTEADVTPGSVLERFALGKELSRGGVGAVFEATETTTSEPVVVKVLVSRRASAAEREQAREAFAREAQVLGTMRHAALPRLLFDGTHREPPFIALEALVPTTLRDVLTPPAPLPTLRASDMISQLASVVAALHEAGIIHRDIKPENVLVDEQDRIHLIDFGLARLRASAGVIVDDVGGTIPYIAPEALDGGSVGPPGDVFALGCLLYETLTGKALFAAPTRKESAKRIRSGDRAPAAAIADPGRDAYYDVVFAATEPDPSRRLRDADLFLAFLEKAMSGERPTPQRREAGFFGRLLGRR